MVAYYRKYLAISDSFVEYKDIIFETIEAYHSGYTHIATMSLFPVLEGGLRNLQEKKLGFDPDNVKSDVFCAGIKKSLLNWGKESLNGFDWWPGKDETSNLELDFFTHANLQCDAINTFLMFFKEVLYKPSKSNNFINGLNRHLILHLLKNDFNEPANFIRIYLALTHIVFIESIHGGPAPASWEDTDEQDEIIGGYIRQLSGIGGLRRHAKERLEIP